MNTTKTIPLIAAAAALATIGPTAGLAPASAAPTQTPGTTLVVYQDPDNAGYSRLAVKGMFPMNEYDAHGFINNLETGAYPGGIDYGLHGDDPDSNDRLLGNMYAYRGAAPRSTGYLTAESDGIHFFQIISVPKSLLNEDDGVFDDTDEVYVVAEFVDGDGGKRSAYSNPVSGTF
ncbi:hypothetical protein [Mycolicibacterium tusciae]|uniref:hypothetical protein n=1 Tax=Mycolicibacterium tusciae TaxID=75922 RepID=UPI00024A2DB3|nr:hypothetical protein [Mycolicibacterium tusciae]